MKVINDIIEWLVQTGLLSVLAIFLLKQLKPILDNKAEHASDRKSTRLNSSHSAKSRMPSSA